MPSYNVRFSWNTYIFEKVNLFFQFQEEICFPVLAIRDRDKKQAMFCHKIIFFCKLKNGLTYFKKTWRLILEFLFPRILCRNLIWGHCNTYSAMFTTYVFLSAGTYCILNFCLHKYSFSYMFFNKSHHLFEAKYFIYLTWCLHRWMLLFTFYYFLFSWRKSRKCS